MMKLLIAFGIWLLVSIVAKAQSLEKSTTEDSKRKTQEVLIDKTKRQEVLNSSHAAKKADLRVQELTGGNEEDTQAIYELTASVFGDMSPEEMQKFMSELQAGRLDPATFGSKFTPEQKKKLSAIADRISARKKNP